MKTVRLSSRSRSNLLHVETPLGIVNIRIGLHDAQGREVVSIEAIPDRYAGDPPVEVDGKSNTRMIQLAPDKFGRYWPVGTDTCPDCGQPDSCGDCTHERLSADQATMLGVVA